MDILEYIIKEALILIPVLLILGVFLKRTPRIADWIIPWVLLVVGVVLALLLLGLTVQALIQGILVTGAAVLGYQLFKQTKNKDIGNYIEE